MTPAARRLLSRAQTLSDRVPTKWLFSGIAGVALAASAAFGGLEDAPKEPLPALEAGEAFTGAQLAIAIDRVVLIDAFPEQYILPEEGNRLLVIVATIENLWDRPVGSSNEWGVASNIRPTGVAGIDADSPPSEVSVLSDATTLPELQSGVPVELAFMWEVPEGALADGEELQVDVYDKEYTADGFVTYGERFEYPFRAATATLPIEDVGAGSAPATDSDADADPDGATE